MAARTRRASTPGTARRGATRPACTPRTTSCCARSSRSRRRSTRRRRASRRWIARRRSDAMATVAGNPPPNPLPREGGRTLDEVARGQAPLLDVNGIEVIYNHVILVLKGVSLQVPEGGIVALLGAERGEVTKGSIAFAGERVDRLDPSRLVRRGVIQVMEGRHCFAHLTVEENLLTGAYSRNAPRSEVRADLEKVYAFFPRLQQRRASLAGYTSGGEQQMTAIGRALMARPRMILLDEPSMGLAPQIVEEIFEIVENLNESQKVSFLLAEQNTMVALRFADFGYILENGRVVLEGSAEGLASNEDVKEFYLGISSGGRRSFRETKHYRRRKRWLA